MSMNQREVRRQYKETIQPMGIFQIKNLDSGKIFLDWSLNLPGSLNRHLFQLEMGSHRNRELQADFSRLGKQAFELSVVDRLDPTDETDRNYTEDMKSLLALWMEKLDPTGDRGYHGQKKA
ncbi:MAG: GIY-YIG nuclease family protein [Bacteroidetes bacterium]|nr:GIY-YIG nuclease family protein [Bacteroidota bacterium]